MLKGLSREEKQTLCTSMKEKVYKAGRMIICEGDEGNTFYIITCAAPSRPAHDGAEARRRARRAER